MGLIVFLIMGFVVGLIARALHPGRDVMGWVATTLLGIGGSFLGWIVGRALGLYREPGLHAAGFVMSIIGAIVLLVIWHFATRRRTFA